MSTSGPRWTGKVELIESKLSEPLHWRKPQRVFVNSMSDLFHENLPYPDILHIFQVMAQCPRCTFQILTKRSAKMRELLSLCWWRNLGHSPEMGGDVWAKVIAGEQRVRDQNFLPNVWLGVSVENQPTADERIPELLETPAAIRFVSYEPALESVKWKPEWLYRSFVDTDGVVKTRPVLDWIIVGGESGPGARPFDVQWARETVQRCKAAGVPVFVKQLGGRPIIQRVDGAREFELKDKKGGDPEEWPADLRVREFPK